VIFSAAVPNVPTYTFPLLGNKWAVGLFFLLHIAFGSFTMGTLVLGPTYELIGRARGSVAFLRYGRWIADINIRIFSLGATLAGFAVIFLLGLYGRFFVDLVTIFWVPFLVAFLIWLPAITALYLWQHHWSRWAPSKLHIGLGYLAAAMDHVFLFMIVGVDSFLLTPSSAGGLGAFFNSSFAIEFAHRFVGNISWGSFFLAGVAALLAGTTPLGPNRAYWLWAAKAGLLVGFLTLIPQMALGFVFAEVVKVSQPGAFAQSFQGAEAWLWLLQSALLGTLLIATNLYFAQSRRPRLAWPITAAVTVCAVATVLPAQVYGHDFFWIRYVVLGVALLLTILHWLVWRGLGEISLGWRPSMAASLAACGLAAVGLLFVMGIIRTSARDPFLVYGRSPQSESQVLPAPSSEPYP
jgi:hypothetical protein